MRSMARWVLPVLVGPRTAVTPAPRRRPSRDAGDDLVVDLAGEQTQRQTDDADVMGEKALDGEMGLAGVGGPKHRCHASAAHCSGTCGKSAHARNPKTY